MLVLVGVVAAVVLLLGCSGARELEQPLRPEQVRPDERRAFECFTQQLPTLLHGDYGSFKWPDGGVTANWYASPEHSRYYVRDMGDRVEFFIAPRPAPKAAGVICVDDCGAFTISYPKEAKDCNAKPEEPRWRP